MSVKIKNRHRLKSKDIRNLLEEVKKDFNEINFDDKTTVEIGDFEEFRIVFIQNIPCFFYHCNKLIITLFGINNLHPKSNYVVVDMGAVKFVTNGADVMAPGIIDADININEGDQVWICDERNKKPLAVGIAEISGNQMIHEEKGKSITMIHHVGDKLWNFCAKSL